MPPWQSPDEFAHFGYTQTIAERFELPGEDPGQRYSREQRLAADRANSDQLAANLVARPEWSEVQRQSWEQADRRLPDSARADGGGAETPGAGNPARPNPPLYYAYEALPYLAGSSGDVFSRLFLMRLASVLFLLVAVAATWKLVGELLGARPVLQLTGAAVVGLQPMAVFLSSSVNPDSMLIAAFALFLLLGVKVLRRGLTPARGVALCACAAAAVLTKGTAYALVPAMLLALGVGAARLRPGSARRLALRVGAPLLAFGGPVAVWVGLARLSDRPAVNEISAGGPGAGVDFPGPLGYLWQYYLPQLPWQTPLPGQFDRIPAFGVWLREGWAAFGWLEVIFPEPVYLLLSALTIALLVGGALALRRSARRRDVATVVFFVLVAGALVAGLHLTEYQAYTDRGEVVNQGRYLLPLLPILSLAAAGTLSLLSGPRRAAAAGLVVGGLFALQIFSIGLVAVRFYA